MRKITRLAAILAICILMAVSVSAAPHNQRDVLFQTSTLSALQEGVYDGNLSLHELLKHGDFGIGTFEGLDGEMIVLGHRVYQVKADGRVYLPDPAAVKTPFAVVTYFDADKTLPLSREMDLPQLQSEIESLFPTQNIPYAVKISGTFKYVKTRSVPRQNKPYPRLAEVTKNQPTFPICETRGTIVGFWLPNYLSGVNMAGFHLHFLSADKKAGGHLLECTVSSGTIAVNASFGLRLVLPKQSAFYQTDLSKDNQKELETIEKN